MSTISKLKQFPIKACTYLLQTAYSHKKKLIFFLFMFLGLNWCRKNLQINHFIFLAEKLSLILTYLPLPEIQTFRQATIYKHVQGHPLNNIVRLMRTQQITLKIKKRETGSWDQMKHSVFTGIMMSLSTYNLSTFYQIVRIKYQEDVKLLKGQQQFQQFILKLQSKFHQSLQLNFSILNQLLYRQIAQIQLRERVTLDQLKSIFVELAKTILDKRYHYYQQNHQKFWKKDILTDKIGNIFYTPYNQSQQSQKAKISNSIFRSIKNVITFPFKILNLAPQIIQQISQQRFELIRTFYILPVKKSYQNIQNLDRQYKKLQKMIISQVQQTIQTLNFNSLIYQYMQLNLKIFFNRINIYLNKINKDDISIAQFLPVACKIIKQEILVKKDKRNKFYQTQIYQAIRLTQIKKNQKIQENQQNDDTSIKDISIQEEIIQDSSLNLNNSILEEIYQSNQFQYLERQFQLKYFHERNKIDIHPSKGKRSKEDKTDQIEQMLRVLSRNQ